MKMEKILDLTPCLTLFVDEIFDGFADCGTVARLCVSFLQPCFDSQSTPAPPVDVLCLVPALPLPQWVAVPA